MALDWKGREYKFKKGGQIMTQKVEKTHLDGTTEILTINQVSEEALSLGKSDRVPALLRNKSTQINWLKYRLIED